MRAARAAIVVPNGTLFMEAETLEQLRSNVRDAVQCHFDEGKAPKVIRLHFVREEVLAS